MKIEMPKVANYMTLTPKTIGFDRPLSHAITLMGELRIRHLPVLKEGNLVGILSDRDIKMVASFENIDPQKILVEEAYTSDPYFISSETDFHEVVDTMARKKIGCAVVMEHEKVIGILTEVDIYRAFSDLLKQIT